MYPFMVVGILYIFYFGFIYLRQVVLSWLGIFKEESKADLACTIKWILIFACSVSIGMNLWHGIRYRPAVAFWHNKDTTFKEDMFKGDTWTFRKEHVQKGDFVKETLRLDYFLVGMEAWQKSFPKELTTHGASYTISVKNS